MITTSVAAILFFRFAWKKRQIGSPNQTAARWLLSAKLLMSIFSTFVSITQANWMPDTLALAADLLNILLLTSKTCKLWSLLADSKAELNTSWTYLGSWAMITLYDIRTVLGPASKLPSYSVLDSSITVLQACSGLALLAVHVLPSYSKLADGTTDNDKPKFGFQKSVSDSIRVSGGHWMWIKKFRVFLSWTWPTGLVWMKFWVVLSLAFKLCETAVELLMPYLLSRFLKKLAEVDIPLDARAAYLLYKIIKIAASRYGISNVRLLLWKPFEIEREMIVQRDIFARIMGYSAVFYRGSNSTSIATACDKGKRICGIFDFVAFNMLPHMIKLIFTGIGLTSIYGIRVAMIQWASAVFNIIIALHMNRFVMSIYDEEQEAKEKTKRRQQDALQGYTTVFASGKVIYEIQRFNSGLKKLAQLAWRTWGCGLVCRLIIGLIHFGSEETAMNLLLRSLVGNQASNAGTVAAFEGYSDILNESLFFFTGAHDDIFDKLYDADQLRQLFETEATVQYGKEKLQCLEGRVNFRNVSCGYTNTDGGVEHIFNNLNCEIQPGKTTAFVGVSGAGKSTMLNLVDRHIEPTEGSIEIDGQDIRALAQGE
jgi:ABC-type multidrug transport system fused ATPase/permease subunit